MRIYLIGPTGVGKSYILNELKKQGIKTFEDPIISKDLLKTGSPYEIQVSIACSFLLRDLINKEGVFDTSIETTKLFSQLQFLNGDIGASDYFKITDLEDLISSSLENSENHFIFIKRSEEEIKDQIIKRGREYELNNPFYEKINETLMNTFNKPNSHLDIIELKGEDISPVVNRVKELLK